MSSSKEPRLTLTRPPDLTGGPSTNLGRWYRWENGEGDGPPVWVHLAYGKESSDYLVDVVVVGTPETWQGPAVTADDLRGIQLGAVYRILGNGRVVIGPTADQHQIVEDDEVEPLTRVKGETSEEFSERVAKQYRRAVTHSRYPATEIAKVSGVSVRTVHAWISQARKHGKLPPGRKGAAG